MVAHGMVNREMIKILKAQGWKPKNNLDFTTLSVNCLEKQELKKVKIDKYILQLVNIN